MKYKVNIFEIHKQWWEFSLSNPDKVRPIHTAIYFRAIEQCNVLGWQKKFGLPTYMTMQYIGISSHKSYFKAFKELIEWKFIKLIKKSVNHHNANIVSLVFLTLVDTSLSTSVSTLVDTSLSTSLSNIKAPHLGNYNNTINTNNTIKTKKDKFEDINLVVYKAKNVEDILLDENITDRLKIHIIAKKRVENNLSKTLDSSFKYSYEKYFNHININSLKYKSSPFNIGEK